MKTLRAYFVLSLFVLRRLKSLRRTIPRPWLAIFALRDEDVALKRYICKG